MRMRMQMLVVMRIMMVIGVVSMGVPKAAI